MEIHCLFCFDSVKFEDYLSHSFICNSQKKRSECPFCTRKITQIEFMEHITFKCTANFPFLKCLLCSDQITLNKFHYHLQYCLPRNSSDLALSIRSKVFITCGCGKTMNSIHYGLKHFNENQKCKEDLNNNSILYRNTTMCPLCLYLFHPSNYFSHWTRCLQQFRDIIPCILCDSYHRIDEICRNENKCDICYFDQLFLYNPKSLREITEDYIEKRITEKKDVNLSVKVFFVLNHFIPGKSKLSSLVSEIVLADIGNTSIILEKIHNEKDYEMGLLIENIGPLGNLFRMLLIVFLIPQTEEKLVRLFSLLGRMDELPKLLIQEVEKMLLKISLQYFSHLWEKIVNCDNEKAKIGMVYFINHHTEYVSGLAIFCAKNLISSWRS